MTTSVKVEILNLTNGIFVDPTIRLGLKKLNDWPTFPQLIINGELVGGLDIVQEMISNGELAETITIA